MPYIPNQKIKTVKDKPLKKVPYGALAQSYKPEGEVISELDLKKVGAKLRYELGNSKQIDALKNIPKKLQQLQNNSHKPEGETIDEKRKFSGMGELAKKYGLDPSNANDYMKLKNMMRKGLKRNIQDRLAPPEV